MKILWSSNAPFVGSGYGQTTARFVPRIKALGHDPAIFCFYGLKGSPLEWEGIPLYPGSADGWGNDVLPAYALHWFRGDRDAGWIIPLMDVWTLNKCENLKNYHVAAWAPVDHTPCPPKVVEFFTTNGAVPLSMSKHGHRMFEEAGLKPIYVPHGTDTNIFKPLDTREFARVQLGIPQDAFVYGMVGANIGTFPMRKAFPEAFQAFAKIHERHPDTFLYLHCIQGNRHTGGKLKRLLEACDVPENAYSFVDQTAYELGEISTEQMPVMYSALDVLVNPAYGEGFGMPIIEAQACGVPVILADNTAMSELCGGGWLVPSEPLWDEQQASWWGRVHVDDLVTAMGKSYHHSAKIRKAARDFVVADYDADDVTEKYWKPALETLEGMLHAPAATPVDLASLKL